LGQDLGSPTRLDRIPPHPLAAAALSPCREVPHILVLLDLLF
jgi:hypothetical protein